MVSALLQVEGECVGVHHAFFRVELTDGRMHVVVAGGGGLPINAGVGCGAGSGPLHLEVALGVGFEGLLAGFRRVVAVDVGP